MELTSAFVYSVRFAQKLVLPKLFQDNIAKLRLIPATYRPNRQHARSRPRRPPPTDAGNWREKILIDFVRRVREVEDSDYDKIFEAFNKVAPANISTLSEEVRNILKSRDEEFRLRVTTLLFDKAISQSFYASVMADMANALNTHIPAVAEDLETHVKMIHTLYDMNTTSVFPNAEDPDFANKVILWAKQKDKRRGFARFLTHLYVRELVPAESLHSAIDSVLADLMETTRQAKSDQTEENVTQFADFLFETAKLLPKTAVELRGLLGIKLGNLLKVPRAELTSLNMRSRFKLEDTVKCVQ
jgi:hypothetical protein